jgi:hypothetical protein
MNEVSTWSGSDRVVDPRDGRGGTMTRSLPLQVLTSSIVIALDAHTAGRYRLKLNKDG